MDNQDNKVVSQFTAQSKKFGSAAYTLSKHEYLDWAVSRMPLKKDGRVLDVAAGTGLLSFAVSPYVGQVVAVDLTPAMLDEGRRASAEKHIQNVLFKQGNAYDLSEERDYDAVMLRLAFHHMLKPEKALIQMVKTVKPGGSVIILDLTSPEDKISADNYNHFESLRDDSHTRALTKVELVSLFKTAALSNIHTDELGVVNDLESWMGMTCTSPQNRDIIKQAMKNDIEGGEKTGFSPYIGEDGDIKFIHRWVMVTGQKPL